SASQRPATIGSRFFRLRPTTSRLSRSLLPCNFKTSDKSASRVSRSFRNRQRSLRSVPVSSSLQPANDVATKRTHSSTRQPSLLWWYGGVSKLFKGWQQRLPAFRGIVLPPKPLPL